jgi:hypothetical protein
MRVGRQQLSALTLLLFSLHLLLLLLLLLPSAAALLLCSGVMFSDQPVQNEEKIFGGRYSDIKIECDPPQKVRLSCCHSC